MYTVVIKGETLAKLKKAVADINTELGNGSTVVKGIQKDLSKEETVVKALGTSLVSNKVESLKEVVQELAVPPVIETPVVAAPVQVEQGTEADAEGMVWDSRIHTKAKTKTKKNVWKLIRGVDQNLVAQVKNEMITAPVVTATIAPIIAKTVEILQAPVAAFVPNVQVAPVVEVTAAPPVVVQPLSVTPNAAQVVTAPIAPVNTNGGHTAETFKANFPMIIATLISENKVTQDYINTLKGHFGVTEIWQLEDAQKEQVFTSFADAGFVNRVG